MITWTKRKDLVSVFDYIRLLGSDIDFEPVDPYPSQPTGAERRSREWLEVMRARAYNGENLWHPMDQKKICSDEELDLACEFRQQMQDVWAEEKRQMAKQNAVGRTKQQQQKNEWNSRYSKRKTERIRPAAFAKHPDVLES